MNSVIGRQVVSCQTTKVSTAGNRTQFAQDLRGSPGKACVRGPARTPSFQGPPATAAGVG